MTAWTAPADIVASADGDVSQYNAETIDNLLHLKENLDARRIIAYDEWATSDSVRSISANSDMVLSSVPFVSGRAYHIRVQSDVNISGAGWWVTMLSINGTQVERLGNHPYVYSRLAGTWLYYASATASYDVRVVCTEVSNGATIQLIGSAASPRRMSVEDIGLQP